MGPKPQQIIPKVNTTLSTTNSTSTSSLQNIMSSTPYSHTQLKNHDLTPEEIMYRSKHIVGIYPITPQDLERKEGDTNIKTLVNTAIEFLQHELGFLCLFLLTVVNDVFCAVSGELCCVL